VISPFFILGICATKHPFSSQEADSMRPVAPPKRSIDARERELTGIGRACLLAPVRQVQRWMQMRGLSTLTAIGIIAASGAAPAAAGEFPFCIKGCDFGGGAGDCSFVSYQQCQATASGRNAYCAANPYFSASAELQRHSGRHSPRRF
jgi:hypothetical protein